MQEFDLYAFNVVKMDLKSLKLFQHLAKSLSFIKTADAMFVSAPTLSRVIARLESEVGTTLFVRNNRRVDLTAAGQEVLNFADKTLKSWHELEKKLDNQEKQLNGEVSVYCSVTASQSYLPPALDKLHTLYPGIEVMLETGDPAVAISKIEDRSNDISIAIHTFDIPASVTFKKIDTVPLLLIVPKSLMISNVEQLRWKDTKVIMPARGPSKRMVYHWFAEQGVRPRVYANVSGNEAIVSMVSLGLGVGFVPELVLNNSVAKSNVQVIAVNNIEPYQIGLCYLTQRANEPLINAVTSQF